MKLRTGMGVCETKDPEEGSHPETKEGNSVKSNLTWG